MRLPSSLLVCCSACAHDNANADPFLSFPLPCDPHPFVPCSPTGAARPSAGSLPHLPRCNPIPNSPPTALSATGASRAPRPPRPRTAGATVPGPIGTLGPSASLALPMGLSQKLQGKRVRQVRPLDTSMRPALEGEGGGGTGECSARSLGRSAAMGTAAGEQEAAVPRSASGAAAVSQSVSTPGFKSREVGDTNPPFRGGRGGVSLTRPKIRPQSGLNEKKLENFSIMYPSISAVYFAVDF